MASHDDITFTVFRGSKSGEIVKTETTRSPLTGDQVLISITASGLCGGDLMFRSTDARFHRYSLLSKC